MAKMALVTVKFWAKNRGEARVISNSPLFISVCKATLKTP